MSRALLGSVDRDSTIALASFSGRLAASPLSSDYETCISPTLRTDPCFTLLAIFEPGLAWFGHP